MQGMQVLSICVFAVVPGWATPSCYFDVEKCHGHLTMYIYKEGYADTRELDFWHTVTMISHSAMSHLVVEDPRKACLFLYIVSHQHVCSQYDCLEKYVHPLPYWDDGRNHIILDLHDQVRIHPDKAQRAMLFTSAGAFENVLRRGCDVSFPQYPKVVFPDLMAVPVDKPRKYRMTFKGRMTYPDTHRKKFVRLHNGKSTIVVGLDGTQKYDDLMNTTYALIIPGQKIATVRLLESMSAGVVPVLVNHGGYVRPFPTLIPWDNCSVTIKPKNPTKEQVLEALAWVSKTNQLRDMQACVRHAYNSYLSEETLGDSMLMSFLQNVQYQLKRRHTRLCIAGICDGSLFSNGRSAMAIPRNYTYSWVSSYYCNNSDVCNVMTSIKVPCEKMCEQRFCTNGKCPRVCHGCRFRTKDGFSGR